MPKRQKPVDDLLPLSKVRNDAGDSETWRHLISLAKDAHTADDPLAVDVCVVACHEAEEALPRWVLDELRERSLVKLGVKADPAKKGGRHTNPEIARIDRHKMYSAFAAVEAAEREGLTGDRKYEIARKTLQERQIHYEVETIKKYHHRYKKNKIKLTKRAELSFRLGVATIVVLEKLKELK